jgi:MFS transporter, MHS family, shikimate and dehydroshikimate transport protein
MMGGLTPFAAATSIAWTGGATWPISVYLIALATITFFAAAVAPETASNVLNVNELGRPLGPR